MVRPQIPKAQALQKFWRLTERYVCGVVFLRKISVVFTGGGSAGHVTPNLALIPILKTKFSNLDLHYIGSEDGIEKEILAKHPEITYHSVRTGKLRRYFSWKNFTDPFRVMAGYHDARKLIKELQPAVVFSKGGFVSVPVAAAAHSCKVPVIAHESDLTPGLANKISARYATKICTTFPDTVKDLPKGVGVYTGSPIRPELFRGDAARARARCAFDRKPVILIMGGSLGSAALNKAVRENVPVLIKTYNIIHLCGKGNIEEKYKSYAPSYRQFEFISEELPDMLALADFVISRAGSNAIHEFLALHKPMLLIPLPLSASRGDQILNAESFEKRGYAIVLREEKITPSTFLSAISYLEKDKQKMIAAMESEQNTNGAKAIAEIIAEQIRCSLKQ